jgi:predicted dehydrogenase
MVDSLDEMEFCPVHPTEEEKRPIVSIGAGGIVNDCHYPAYKLAGYSVIGLFDLKPERAQMMAEKFGVPTICPTIDDAVKLAQDNGAIFDIAVPASRIPSVLEHIPDGSATLIQKPMGENIQQARKILDMVHEKRLTAGINFQLRDAPYIIAAKQMVDKGLLGTIVDMEVRETVFTPWNLWDFLYKVDRMEINYHSIHWVDMIRYFLGDPKGVYCKTMKHPEMDGLAQVKSNIIMDYGDYLRAGIISNHNHKYGLDEQECFIKIEGTKGCIKITTGVYLDYPKGKPDVFKYNLLDDGKGWRTLDVHGSWFPEAFVGTMGGLMKKVADPNYHYINNIDDAYKTMCVCEACYESSAHGETPVEYE